MMWIISQFVIVCVKNPAAALYCCALIHNQLMRDVAVACVKLREMCIKSSFLRHQGLDASVDMARLLARHWRLSTHTPHQVNSSAGLVGGSDPLVIELPAQRDQDNCHSLAHMSHHRLSSTHMLKGRRVEKAWKQVVEYSQIQLQKTRVFLENVSGGI